MFLCFKQLLSINQPLERDGETVRTASKRPGEEPSPAARAKNWVGANLAGPDIRNPVPDASEIHIGILEYRNQELPNR